MSTLSQIQALDLVSNCHPIFYTTSFLTTNISNNNDNLSQITITSSSSNSSLINYSINKGKWLPDENERFLEGVAKYGGNWRKIQSNIRTRTTTQARSHAQKIILKIKHKKLLKIPSWVNTIQELFCLIKQFPHKTYKNLCETILLITNEDLKGNNSKQRKVNNKECKSNSLEKCFNKNNSTEDVTELSVDFEKDELFNANRVDGTDCLEGENKYIN